MHVLALLLAAATTHSWNSAPGTAVLKAPTACSIVSKAEIEEALGQPVSAGVEHKSPAESTCDYAAGEGKVTIALAHSSEKLDADAEAAVLKKILPEGAVREASIIGARAFFLDIPHAGAQLHVVRGDHDYLMVSVLGFGGPAQVSDTALRIAHKALERL